MNEHPKKRKRKTLHPSRYSGQSRALSYVHFIFSQRTLWARSTRAAVRKTSSVRGGMRSLGLNVPSAHPVHTAAMPLSASAAERFCSVLPADGDTCSSYKVKMMLLTPKGGNFLEVRVEVSISVQCWTNCAPVAVLSGSRIWYWLCVILQTSGRQLKVVNHITMSSGQHGTLSTQEVKMRLVKRIVVDIKCVCSYISVLVLTLNFYLF